jgi:Probable sensor domain DACNV
MTRSTYPPASQVAAIVEEHFRRHSPGGAHVPAARAVEQIVDAAFWASLRRDEGRAPRISLAFLPPSAAGRALMLERRLSLDPATLTRIAPAAERRGIHVGIWSDGDTPYVWGATRTLPPFCFVLEVVDAGLLVIKHRRADPSDGAGKFGNVAVLQGDQVKVVDAAGVRSLRCPQFVTSLIGFDVPAGHGESVLLQLALSMRAHGHGGSLLVVPQGSEEWRQSILWPVPYAISPPFSALTDLKRAVPDGQALGAEIPGFRAAIEAIGGLTAVDGATVLSDRWEVLAFGAKIGRRAGSVPVERLLVIEPIVGRAPVAAHPAELGGTRHLSAAQFAHEQHDALALVASQDGEFTVFSWSDPEEVVHAYRVESLLM